MDEVPNLEFFISNLQRAAQQPETVVECCSRVLSAAEYVSNCPASEFGRLFERPTSEVLKIEPSKFQVPTTVAGQESVSQFTQNLTLLVERHENVQPLLLR